MKYQERKLALVIDNAPNHKIFELDEVELIFFTTKHDWCITY